MARAIWSGAISFGLVNVPVKLYSATESHTIAFHQFQEGTGQRIRYKRVAEESGREVPYEKIVKGYEIEKGRYVIIEPEELEAVEPRQSRTIDIEDFVDLAAIDPIYWEKTYYLGPAEGVGAEKPYALLREALKETGKVAIARFVMRTKQYLATIRPIGELLALETMFFADEIRGADAVENRPGRTAVNKRELQMAEQLVQSLSAEWDPMKYRDTYRERVLELIERKARGEEIVEAVAPEPEAKVVNLRDALEASLRAARGGNGRERLQEASRGDGHARARTRRGTSTKRAKAPASRAHAKGRGDGKLQAMTKTALLEEAARADISGRTKMSKEQLIHALEGASP